MKARRFFVLMLAVVMLLTMAACGQSESGGSSQASSDSTASVSEPESQESSASSEDAASEPESEPESAPVKSDGYEKFSQLEIGMTESEVNAILGEPTSVDKAYYYYNIMVSGQELEITVWISMVTEQVIYFNGDFYKDGYRDEFADSAVDFSGVDALDTGELDTYDACAAAFKTPGYLITMEEDGASRYMWVDSNDGELCVSFRADGTVKSYSGYC